MSAFVEFLVRKMKKRVEDQKFSGACPLDGMDVCEGQYYSTLTGSDPPYVEIDWEKLQANIQALEDEFKAQQGKQT